MKLLALDSSSLVASVAVITDQVMTAEYTINYKKTHSQTLLPMIDEISRMIDLDLDSVDAIAVAAGPGSFTGLRIGSATAKGLGLALNKPIIAVPTLDAMAYNLAGTNALAVPVMDARRSQVYTGIYEFHGLNMQILKASCAVGIEELIKELNQTGREVIFVGDGIPVFQEIIKEKLFVPCLFAPAHLNRQRAGAVGALGAVYYREGRMENARDHKPEYLRKPQAERELEEKRKTS